MTSKVKLSRRAVLEDLEEAKAIVLRMLIPQQNLPAKPLVMFLRILQILPMPMSRAEESSTESEPSSPY